MRLRQYITDSEQPDPNMAKAQNRAIYKGQKFWAGVYNYVTDEIMTTTTYENAEKHDFHHSMYMTKDAIDAMEKETAVFFWVLGYDTSGVVKNPKINVDWHTNIGPVFRGSTPHGFANSSELTKTGVINKIKRLVRVK